MSRSSLRIPVFMYHKVGALLPDGTVDRFISVPPANFERHIAIMQRLGYIGITFENAARQLSERKLTAPKQFAVTFDDGYSCVGDNAAPILEKAGIPATVFVVSDAVGETNSWDFANNKPVLPLMGKEQLLALQSMGWELAGHTRSHPHLELLSEDEALADIMEGKSASEAWMGREQHTFCYPYGGLNASTPNLVKRAGYLAACTTKSGMASSDHHLMLLPRVKISYSDGAAGLLYKVMIRPKLPTLRKKR